jgi:GrpB-like predicted nucleotidyltransferase (UPF0157 family)
MIGLTRGIVELHVHDENWSNEAQIIIEKLKSVLGSLVLGIEHVGSTSIKHIKAKPIIDIAVLVDNFTDIIKIIPKLEEAGFIARQYDDENELLFVCGDLANNFITHHIHFTLKGHKEWTNYINYRNYLNTFPEIAKQYETLKLELMLRYKYDRESYTAGKADFITYTLRKALVWSYLGIEVEVIIDRKLGSTHPKHCDIVYLVNYGYIQGVYGGDNKELDVYVLGINVPIDTFKGRVIGIVHRENDIEDKLVAAPLGVSFTKEEIASMVKFQEQYFQTRVECI